MKRYLPILIFCLGSLARITFADEVPAGYEREAAEARALLTRAVERYEQVGDAAFAEFNRQGRFTSQDLYTYVVDTRGTMLASGGPSALLIGRDVTPLLDASLREAFIETLREPESGMVQSREYRWMNWRDNRIERKRAYYQRIGDRIFAAGYYMPRSSRDEAERLLDDAQDSLQQDPLATLARINRLDPFFNRDDLYVYVVDLETEKFVAHGFLRRLIGTGFRTLKSRKGTPIGELALQAIRYQNAASITYDWINPVTGAQESKEALLRRSGKHLLAVGFYVDRL